jgi:hypothetical protein
LFHDGFVAGFGGAMRAASKPRRLAGKSLRNIGKTGVRAAQTRVPKA